MAEPNHNLLSALRKAQQDGFINDLVLNEHGDLASPFHGAATFHIIEIVPCLSCGATLYLIANEHMRGTWVHHWDI